MKMKKKWSIGKVSFQFVFEILKSQMTRLLLVMNVLILTVVDYDDEE